MAEIIYDYYEGGISSFYWSIPDTVSIIVLTSQLKKNTSVWLHILNHFLKGGYDDFSIC